jgi:predicted alpha/beta-fold hydrolase
VPALVVSAGNDPFVRKEMFDAHRGASNGRLRFEMPDRGGHVGFWQTGSPRFWAGGAVVSSLEAIAG